MRFGIGSSRKVIMSESTRTIMRSAPKRTAAQSIMQMTILLDVNICGKGYMLEGIDFVATVL